MQEHDDLQAKIADAKAQDDARKDESAAQESELSELDQLKTQLTEMTELNKRLLADVQNQKRRAAEERTLTITMANANLIKELLPVVDNLDRAMEHLPEEHKQGLEMSIRQTKEILTRAGLEEIEATGTPFNPDLHEAVAQVAGEKDTVVEVFEKGYRIGNRVIRHSKVAVGTG